MTTSKDEGPAIGLKGQARVVVAERHTARAVGSGMVEVFASPMMIALMEAAAVECVEARMPPGSITLGIHLDVHHVLPTPMGRTVVATAVLTAIDGRRLDFDVEAHDGATRIGHGRHTRIIVDQARFLARLGASS